jgi:6-phosphofructokinase
MTKRIGILTSGGDCGGLNAIIRAVTLRATSAYVWEVVGIRNGSMGLLRDPARLGAAGSGRGDG